MNKVLLVDDERMIVNSLLLGFPWKAHGFEVVATATSGREALAQIERLHPDVVITDVKMPGMSGLDLMNQCRDRAPDTVFVVISGHAEFSFAQKAMSLGAVAYCLKPLENDEIAAALRQAKRSLAHADELRHAALLRFLDAPVQDNARRLLAPYPIEGMVGVGLSLGDALPLLQGHVPVVNFQLDEQCRLYIILRDVAYLDSYAFRASLLGAVSAGALTAFVYDATDDPIAFLCERLVWLMDQLYAGFFVQERMALGRAQPVSARDTAWLDNFTALCNRNRLYGALNALDEVQPEQAAMSDALRMHALCEALLCRIKNLSPPKSLRYGYELVARYRSFAQLRTALARRLQQAGGVAVDPESLHNETLQRIVTEINRCFPHDLQFQTLCAHYRINPSYLSQLFKKEIDMTFTSYVNLLRISYAKELLDSTTLLMSEISDRVGYENYLTFTKLFKKETGLTPKQYRAERHGKQPVPSEA